MSLDDFTSGSTSKSKTQQSDEENDEEEHVDVNTDSLSGKIDTGVDIQEEAQKVNKKKKTSDPDAYDQEYLKECYRCGDKSILLPFLSDIGNVWFCSDTECINSVAHQCNYVASSKQLANEVDVQAVHNRMNELTDTDPRNMGLDDFTSGDSSSSTDTSTSEPEEETKDSDEDDDFDVDELASKLKGNDSSSTVEESDPSTGLDREFYNTEDVDLETQPMERKGAMSNLTTSEMMEHTEGSIDRSDDDIKYHSPTFPIITTEDQYEQGSHYRLNYTDEQPKASWHNRVVTCISSVKTTLGEMNKEVVMYAFGSPSKKKVMDKATEMLGEDLDGSTDVYINFFGDSMFMRDMAQANMEYRVGDKLDRDKVGSRVLKKNMLRAGLNEREEANGD
jgi:hypothetical protein